MSDVLFTEFLYRLRGEGLVVGIGEWRGLLLAMERGLIVDVESLYAIGRALLCRSETEYDQYDVAFAKSFNGAVISEEMKSKLEEWLARAADLQQQGWVDHGMDAQELWDTFRERLAEQKERHDGGNRWIGTGGTSPFGHSGRGARGIRTGGQGGGRQAVAAALERQWANYRTDRVLDVRDLKMALRTLRNLAREGDWNLSLDRTIDATAKNAGDIALVEERERVNRVHVVLLMDAGGSMRPHYEKVNRLFSAASATKTFKTFTPYYFHNCIYQHLYKDIEQLSRVPTTRVLEELTPKHRLIFVGDASMAPYELFSAFGWYSEGALAGLEWLQRFRSRCKASVWLNPDPRRYWDHPTVDAIGRVFPMHELTVEGLRSAIRILRAPL